MAFSHLSSPDTVLEHAVTCLKSGGLVAVPTETVYGLGADASNPSALKRLYEVKGRPTAHPVIVHLGATSQVEDWASTMPQAARDLADAFWPGPLTLILPRAAHVLDQVTGGQSTVGLRIPNHPLTLALLKHFEGGLAAPSANRFGRISPTTAQHVQAEIGPLVDLILDGGPCTVGVESTIVDLSQGVPRILRPGMIAAKQIEAVLGIRLDDSQSGMERPRAPGVLKSHYSPDTPMTIVSAKQLEDTACKFRDSGIKVGVMATRPSPVTGLDIPWIQMSEDPVVYAQQLYATLRMLDSFQCDRILVESVSNTGLWEAIHNRLERAAYRSGQAKED